MSRRTSKLLKKLAVGMVTTSASLRSATTRVKVYSPCSAASFDVEAFLLVAYHRYSDSKIYSTKNIVSVVRFAVPNSDRVSKGLSCGTEIVLYLVLA